MKFKKSILAAAVIAGAMLSTASFGSVFDTVKQRGVLNCGTDNGSPGFGYLNTKTGKMEGIDVDLCRAVAVAVLGDASKVNYVIVTDKSRFTAVQTNQVDVVFAHTTVTSARETAVGVDFLPTYFWDGTGMMVLASSGIKSMSEMEGATICTTQGSGTETDVSNLINGHGWKGNQVLTFENVERMFSALNSGRCNGMVTDKSALAAWRGNAAKPSDYVIVPEIMSKAPFGGFVVANDSKWRNTLRWTIYALFQAEESGITSANVGEKLKSSDPWTKKFLGVGNGFGKDFGLPDSFIATMIKEVGNYAEIYDRSIGPNTPYALDRKGTPNAAQKDGGSLASPVWY